MKFILFVMSTLLLSYAQATCVSGNEVELKTKPDGKSKVSWVVGRYMPLLEVTRKREWVQVVDVDNSTHWIHARHITGKFNCVVVRAETANLRVGPGTQYPATELSYAGKYSTFKKLDRDEEWVKVQDEFGKIHWLHENTIWEPRIRSKVSFQ